MDIYIKEEIAHFRAFSADGLPSPFIELTCEETAPFYAVHLAFPQPALLTEVGNCAKAILSPAINV